jgi:phospholipid/cholesterol/gamma-HCH transport system substrate-binding protein
VTDQDNTRTPLRKLGPSKNKARVQSRGRRGPNPVVKSGRWLVGHPWSVLGAAVAVWFVIWVIGTRSDPHHIKAAFPTAFNLKPGQDVAIDGRDAGKISKVDYKDGRSIVELGIKDEYWPIPQGTTATSRYGTTIGSGTRRVDLKLGPANAKKLPEGGIIATKDTRSAVDVDAVLNTLNGETRESVTDLTQKMERALSGAEEDTNESIAATPEGLKQIDEFLKDLGSDSVALSGLITNADRFTRVLASREQRIQDLVTVSSRTFGAFADRSQELQQTLDGIPPALSETRTTLARVDGSLGGLQELVDDVRPGAKRIRPLAKAATPALQNLSSIVPAALSTVRTTTKVSPELNTLLTNGTPFLAKVGRVTKEATPMLDCIRPYAPDAIGAVGGLASWSSSYIPHDPNNDQGAKQNNGPYPFGNRIDPKTGFVRQHGIRARVNVSAASLHSNPLTPAEFVAISGKTYAYPRPAGYGVGKPIWQPQCEITKDSLDPSKDLEVAK